MSSFRALRKDRDRREKTQGCLLMLAIAVTIGLIFYGLFAPAFHTETVTFTVTDKEVKRSGKSDIYLVFTEGTTYAIEDSIIHGNWDSSDDYGRIKVGHTYRAKVYGWRVPFLSMYQTIYEFREVPRE